MLSDTINCFDQLNESSKVRIKKTYLHKKMPKKLIFGFSCKKKLFKVIMPPFIAICSLFLFSYSYIYFYNPFEDKEKNELINQK